MEKKQTDQYFVNIAIPGISCGSSEISVDSTKWLMLQCVASVSGVGVFDDPSPTAAVCRLHCIQPVTIVPDGHRTASKHTQVAAPFIASTMASYSGSSDCKTV